MRITAPTAAPPRPPDWGASAGLTGKHEPTGGAPRCIRHPSLESPPPFRTHPPADVQRPRERLKRRPISPLTARPRTFQTGSAPARRTLPLAPISARSAQLFAYMRR
eukprot:7964331-Pyramimonas_sp.AAC.1